MLDGYLKRYRTELLESVMPFWLENSVDRDFGGFFSCLDRVGEVYGTRKYVWQQGRAVWMLSRLYRTVEPRPEWFEAARTGAEFLQRYGVDSGGRCYFSLTREGRPVHYQRKPYSAVFTALGFLEYGLASGEKAYQDEAIELFWRIRSWIEFPGMIGRPILSGEPADSKLADVMVSAMLGMEFLDALSDRRYLRVVEDSMNSARLHADPEKHILMESVPPNGAKLYGTPDSRLCCPGHSIEVVWLLLKHLKRYPDSGWQRELLTILEGTLEFAWDREFGGLYYFKDIKGKPTLPLESGMKLWWPHTEAIHAVILAYSVTGEQKWLDWLARIDEYAFRHFADPEHGEWFGYCDRRGGLTNDCKGNNYKGMFHVPRFLLFSIQALEEIAHRGSVGA